MCEEVFEGIPVSRVLEPEEIAADAQMQHMESLVTQENGLFSASMQPRPPYLFSGTPVKIGGPSPAYGEHTEEVLQGLGFTASDIAALME